MGAVQPLDPEVLRAANINPVTGLATDYLNHYNEVAMLVSMLSDMPDMAEEILDWGPIDYPTHFHQTGFRDKELAIAAWEAAAPDVRARFDAARREVEHAIAGVQDALRAAPETAANLAPEAAGLFELIAAAGGVVNGEGAVEIDAPDASDEQALIDSLFD